MITRNDVRLFIRLTWNIAKWFWRLIQFVPMSAEMFFRYRFGYRYVYRLWAALGVLMLFALAATQPGSPLPSTIDILSPFCFASFVMCVVHHLKRDTRMHSKSRGVSWPLWSRLGLSNVTTRHYIEPALGLCLSVVALPVDSSFSYWMFLSSTGLFIKEKWLAYSKRRQTLDAWDNRVDSNRLQRRLRRHTESAEWNTQSNTVRRAEARRRRRSSGRGFSAMVVRTRRRG